MKKTKLFLLLPLISFLIQCSTVKRLNINEFIHHDNRTTEIKFFINKNFDKYGLPYFKNEIRKKPSSTIDSYYIVIIEKGKVIKSLYIRIINKKEFKNKSLKTIYKWTGKGFNVGVKLSKGIIKNLSENYFLHPGAGAGIFIITVVPVAISSIGGFFIGIADGTKLKIEDLKKTFKDDHEFLIGHTTFLYDKKNRLIDYKLYSPDKKHKLLVHTKYKYLKNSKKPFTVRIHSIFEKKDRILIFNKK